MKDGVPLVGDEGMFLERTIFERNGDVVKIKYKVQTPKEFSLRGSFRTDTKKRGVEVKGKTGGGGGKVER